MKSDDEIAEEIFDRNSEALEQGIENIISEEQVLIAVYSAQAVICNGGFRYFFENDFTGNSGIEIVIASYQKIGLDEHAQKIIDLLKLFPNSVPHENLEARYSFLKKYFDEESKCYLPAVAEAEELFYKDSEQPYKLAAKYIRDTHLTKNSR